MNGLTKEAEEKIAAQVNTIFSNVYAPAFFQKLAAYGIKPTSEEAAEEYLKLAIDLRQQGAVPETEENQEVEAIKQARAVLNPGLSLHENAASSNGLVEAFVNNEEIRKIAKENIITQLELMNQAEQV